MATATAPVQLHGRSDATGTATAATKLAHRAADREQSDFAQQPAERRLHRLSLGHRVSH